MGRENVCRSPEAAVARTECLMMSEGGMASALMRAAAGGSRVPTAANNAVVSDFIRNLPESVKSRREEEALDVGSML